MRLAILLAVCVTAAEMNDKICWVACRKDGYDTGKFSKNKCICGVERDFEEITGTTIFILPVPPPEHAAYRYGY